MKRVASAVFCAILCGLLATGVSTAQEPSASQVTYYVDSLGVDDGMSALYAVELDDVGMIANLNQLVVLDSSLGFGTWNNVDVLAATPDGKRLYFINDGNYTGATNGMLGYYDIDTGVVGIVGVVSYTDFGSTVPGENTTDQGAIAPDGAMYITRVTNETLYRVDLSTAVATPVGAYRNAANNVMLNLQGADIAFDAEGRFYIWANRDVTGAPRGLYAAASTTLPASGDILLNYLGTNEIYYTGLAFLDLGFGNILASGHSDVFVEIDRSVGAKLKEYEPRLAGETTQFITGNGDMTTAQLGVIERAFCTLTIGYWKNHEWPHSTIINGDEITEEEGRGTKDGYLWQARGNNFSMLYAQLIAAKLNCPFCVDVWTEAEAFLASNGITEDNFDARFPNKWVRREASRLSRELDWFNNAYHCSDK